METPRKTPSATADLPPWTHGHHDEQPWCRPYRKANRCVRCTIETTSCISFGNPAYMPNGRPRCTWLCGRCLDSAKMTEEILRAMAATEFLMEQP